MIVHIQQENDHEELGNADDQEDGQKTNSIYYIDFVQRSAYLDGLVTELRYLFADIPMPYSSSRHDALNHP